MGRLGTRGAGYNICFGLFLKPRDVRLGEPETVPQVCPSPFSGIIHEKLAITTLTRMGTKVVGLFRVSWTRLDLRQDMHRRLSDVRIIHYFRGGMQVLPVLEYILTRAPDSHFSTCCYVF